MPFLLVLMLEKTFCNILIYSSRLLLKTYSQNKVEVWNVKINEESKQTSESTRPSTWRE